MSVKKTLKQFIKDAKTVHGDTYRYAFSVYVTSTTPLLVTCPLHGNFSITPSNHVSSSRGCKKCSRINRGNYIRAYTKNKKLGNADGMFYEVKFTHKIEGFSFLKIGITSRSIKSGGFCFTISNASIPSEAAIVLQSISSR